MANPLFFAIVPAKGHSERVPDKNIRPMSGRPLLEYIFETLSRVPVIERIILDTDSTKIADMVATRFDVEISMRPEHLCCDFVSVNRLIEHVMGLFPSQHLFLQTHVTNPFLAAETITAACRFFLGQSEYDSLFTVLRHQSRFYDHQFRPVNHDPAELIRTQDLPPLFEENSNLYLFSRDSFTKTKARIGAAPYLWEMAPMEAVDIDVESDFVLAEAIARGRTGKCT